MTTNGPGFGPDTICPVTDSDSGPASEQVHPLHFRPSSTGSVRIDSELEWPEFQELNERISQLGDEAKVSSRVQVWAGPYEIYLALQPLIDSVAGIVGATTGVVGAGTGVTALLMELVRRKPEQPISIHVDNSTTIVINGTRQLSPQEESAVEEFFRRHSADPNDPDWQVHGAGQ